MAGQWSVAQGMTPCAYHVIAAMVLCVGLSVFILWYAVKRAHGRHVWSLTMLGVGLVLLAGIIFAYGLMTDDCLWYHLLRYYGFGHVS